MAPPEPPRRRQPSRPELEQVVDQQPERRAVRHHPGLDGAPAPAPTRRGTLPGGMAAIPQPPPLPGELSPTAPAPRLDAPTLRATPAAGTAIAAPQVVEIETTPAGQPAPSTPAPVSADQASLAAVRAQRDDVTTERDELRREVAALREASLKRAAESINPDGSVESLRKALSKVLLGLAALLALLAVPLTSYVQALATRIERTASQAAQANNAAETAKERTGAQAKTNTTTEQQFRQYRANMREVLRLQGIVVPKHDGDPEPEKLEPVTPLCQSGKVCPGPQLILTKPP